MVKLRAAGWGTEPNDPVVKPNRPLVFYNTNSVHDFIRDRQYYNNVSLRNKKSRLTFILVFICSGCQNILDLFHLLHCAFDVVLQITSHLLKFDSYVVCQVN